MKWQPSFGAWPDQGGTRFRVWAPEHRRIEVVLEGQHGGSFPLHKTPDGTFGGLLSQAQPGSRYRYRVSGGGPFPDPASRFQPEGVHGPSEVVDPGRFAWSDADWRGVVPEDLSVYELHVGTFTPAGTFAAVSERLPYLRDLGVTAIELMPLADFPGGRNWGYDGVHLFAPARCYGVPDDLRRLVDAAHRHGLAVLLDVVYNHLGPDGNYLSAFSPHFFSRRHGTPWGSAPNFDGEHSPLVRAFFIDNALHWLHEYHLDGLRLDATCAIVDNGPRHILAELAGRVRESVSGRRVMLIAEDSRNFAHIVKPEAQGGWGLDAIWTDDFTDQVRRILAGDDERHYRDFRGTMTELAATLNQGWLYCGQQTVYSGKPSGTDPAGLPPRRFLTCIQNHDEAGNRAFGERLHHQIGLDAYRAASALLLCAPCTPLLFMGQEWAAGTPFLFFTDHHKRLGQKVTEGRCREFREFAAFRDPAMQARIPGPQELSTFLASKLVWPEQEREPHAATLRLYRALLALRRTEPALRSNWPGCAQAAPLGENALLLRRDADGGPSLLVLAQMRGEGTVDLTGHPLLPASAPRGWEVVLTTDDAPFAPEPAPPCVLKNGPAPVVQFMRPSVLVLRATKLPKS